jgi:hypothetical protein
MIFAWKLATFRCIWSSSDNTDQQKQHSAATTIHRSSSRHGVSVKSSCHTSQHATKPEQAGRQELAGRSTVNAWSLIATLSSTHPLSLSAPPAWACCRFRRRRVVSYQSFPHTVPCQPPEEPRQLRVLRNQLKYRHRCPHGDSQPTGTSSPMVAVGEWEVLMWEGGATHKTGVVVLCNTTHEWGGPTGPSFSNPSTPHHDAMFFGRNHCRRAPYWLASPSPSHSSRALWSLPSTSPRTSVSGGSLRHGAVEAWQHIRGLEVHW